MNIVPNSYYMDNDEVVYKCLVVKTTGDYSEAVLEVQGETSAGTFLYAVFYRANWAWIDRENPDFRLTEEVEYYPRVVQ
jgi:hypothetical protein